MASDQISPVHRDQAKCPHAKCPSPNEPFMPLVLFFYLKLKASSRKYILLHSYPNIEKIRYIKRSYIALQNFVLSYPA